MPTVRATSGTPVFLDGAEFVIRGKPIGNLIHLENIADGQIQTITKPELIAAIDGGRATLPGVAGDDRERGRRIQAKLDRDLDSLNSTERKALDRRLAYVRAVAREEPVSRTEAGLGPIIEAIAKELGDEPPHWGTVCRWLRDHRTGQGDPRALVPAYGRRGNRNPRIDPEVERLVTEGLDIRYLTEERGGAEAARDFVLTSIELRNKFRPEQDHLRSPSLRTFYRRIDKMDPYTRVCRRYGKRAADLKFRPTFQGPETSRILERVEMDHTKFDLFVIDDQTSIPIGRTWLSFAIDHYSRMPIGLHIDFQEPSWQSVMHCLRQAILPKDAITARFPSIENTWDCCGVPEVLVVDNGREFHSKHMEEACEQLGIEIQYSPARTPRFKGAVERHFKTINEAFLAGTKGRTFSNLFDKGDYDPKKNAVVPVTLLTEALCKWLIDVYARDYHRGIDDVPAERWKRCDAQLPARLPTSKQDLNVLLGMSEQRTIQQYGIELESLRYNSNELGALRAREYRNRNPTVSVKLDPTDISSIHVLDPQTKKYFKVPACYQSYTQGLGLWQHKIIKRYARKAVGDSKNEYALARAREDIRKMVLTYWEHVSATGGRQRAAKYLGINSERVISGTPTEAEILTHSEKSMPEPIYACAETGIELLEEVQPDEAELADTDDWGVGYDLPIKED